MSHFTVMVIGDNPQEQLAPYDENIEVEPYYKKDVAEKDKESFIDVYTKVMEGRHYGVQTEEDANENSKLSFDELYTKYGEDWNQNEWVKDSDGIWKVYSTYNPKSKWDWYQLGGRWSGDILKLKDGKTGNFGKLGTFDNKVGVDQARFGDIDFDGMVNDAAKEAYEKYVEVENIFDGEIPKLDYFWKDVVDVNNPLFNQMTIVEKRDLYNKQPAVLKSNEANTWLDIEEFQCTCEEYVSKAKENAVSTFAVVKDGVWYEKGEMGWWACVSGEKEQNDWNKEVKNLLDGLSDDTLISIYDCHI